ncbi:MAG: flavin reductase [Melioribacteraceae bacterium]|nr:flavin reductase [Melioribacteraceae bacterium]
MKITKENIYEFDKIYRANLINSLAGFKSANLIGTISTGGKTNLAVFNSVIHVGANPPLIGFLMRPVTVERHTYMNIKETGYFTINHINLKIYKSSHQTSARYDRDISEFDQCGLTEEFIKSVKAPYVKESNIKIGLKFVEEVEIKSNGTILIVGEIIELIVPDGIIGSDGYADIENAGSIAISGLDGYHQTKKITRLTYAKPGIQLTEF